LKSAGLVSHGVTKTDVHRLKSCIRQRI